jgi:PAS domain-containing protein
LMLVLTMSPGATGGQTRVMLARVRPNGLFELLSVPAWARALGYRPEELSGRSLRMLMQLEKPADNVVAALLDENDAQPLDVTLRCKDERRKRFRLHRRFDSYDKAVFVLADELPEDRIQPLRTCG